MAPRILQIGCGHWGKNVLRDLVELGASVTVLARSEATAERARAGGAAAVVSGWRRPARWTERSW